MQESSPLAVVVTGSTKGIGRALAAEFHRRGHDVVVTGRTAAAVDEAVDALGSTAGGRVVGQAVDVSDPAAVDDLWKAAVTAFGRVDLWVNNAGVAHTTETIVDTTADDVRAMVTTNMLGTIHGSQTAVRGMSTQGGGRLFNVLGGGSDGSIRPGMGVYGATKRGLDHFTRSLVKEVADTGVLVGQIRPGILITDGWLREAARDPDRVAAQRRAISIISDHAEDVAPYLVSQMLATSKNGAEIAWLTTGKLTRRFLTPGYAKKHDVLERYGL